MAIIILLLYIFRSLYCSNEKILLYNIFLSFKGMFPNFSLDYRGVSSHSFISNFCYKCGGSDDHSSI